LFLLLEKHPFEVVLLEKAGVDEELSESFLLCRHRKASALVGNRQDGPALERERSVRRGRSAAGD
jgi:hypothetical protein